MLIIKQQAPVADVRYLMPRPNNKEYDMMGGWSVFLRIFLLPKFWFSSANKVNNYFLQTYDNKLFLMTFVNTYKLFSLCTCAKLLYLNNNICLM